MDADTYLFGINRLDTDHDLAETRNEIEADEELDIREKAELYCAIIARLMFLRKTKKGVA